LSLVSPTGPIVYGIGPPSRFSIFLVPTCSLLLSRCFGKLCSGCSFWRLFPRTLHTLTIFFRAHSFVETSHLGKKLIFSFVLKHIFYSFFLRQDPYWRSSLPRRGLLHFVLSIPIHSGFPGVSVSLFFEVVWHHSLFRLLRLPY